MGWFPEIYELPSSPKTAATLGSLHPLKIPGRSGKGRLIPPLCPPSPVSRLEGKSRTRASHSQGHGAGTRQEAIASLLLLPENTSVEADGFASCLIQNGSSRCAAVTKVAIGRPEKCTQAALAGVEPDNSGLLPIQLWAVTWPRLDDGVAEQCQRAQRGCHRGQHRADHSQACWPLLHSGPWVAQVF